MIDFPIFMIGMTVTIAFYFILLLNGKIDLLDKKYRKLERLVNTIKPQNDDEPVSKRKHEPFKAPYPVTYKDGMYSAPLTKRRTLQEKEEFNRAMQQHIERYSAPVFQVDDIYRSTNHREFEHARKDYSTTVDNTSTNSHNRSDSGNSSSSSSDSGSSSSSSSSSSSGDW